MGRRLVFIFKLELELEVFVFIQYIILQASRHFKVLKILILRMNVWHKPHFQRREWW